MTITAVSLLVALAVLPAALAFGASGVPLNATR